LTCTNLVVLLMLVATGGTADAGRTHGGELEARPDPTAPEAQSPSSAGHFVRFWWYEPGLEHGNPITNRRFRVNAPEVVTHPTFGARPEAKSSGMLQILMREDLRLLQAVELELELWGGHPGTTNRRVTVNGRHTYSLPGVAGDAQCTHMYPRQDLKVTDLVDGYNALQFACDQGTSFWGHFIVDEACLRVILKADHPDLKEAGLSDFHASIRTTPSSRGAETIDLVLDATEDPRYTIESVDYQGYYEGYDENGDGRTRDWHGFTKKRRPVATLGTATGPSFAATWDLVMLPAQDNMAVRAHVRFKGRPELAYVTLETGGLRVPERPGVRVELVPADDLPVPFWSRANRTRACTIALDADSAQIERAELHVVVWDGGAGTVNDYFTMNGRPLPVAGSGKHDVIYSRRELDTRLLERGTNRIELRSDTEHHGIEVLMPGPALMVRRRTGP
jgi:hypothetical protein